MRGVVIEEKYINRTQYLDLVYSQSETLFELIPHTLVPSTDPSKPPFEPPLDGVLGSGQP